MTLLRAKHIENTPEYSSTVHMSSITAERFDILGKAEGIYDATLLQGDQRMIVESVAFLGAEPRGGNDYIRPDILF